jgi:rare lipoprotein A
MIDLIARRGRPLLAVALSMVLLTMRGAAVAQSAEEGMATFYSEKFVGKKTASGEAYDKGGLSAAHRSYAYGTKLRVTNLANGKSAVVTVNDRMPRTSRSVIELTPRVARLLGFVGSGKATVMVEVVK